MNLVDEVRWTDWFTARNSKHRENVAGFRTIEDGPGPVTVTASRLFCGLVSGWKFLMQNKKAKLIAINYSLPFGRLAYKLHRTTINLMNNVEHVRWAFLSTEWTLDGLHQNANFVWARSLNVHGNSLQIIAAGFLWSNNSLWLSGRDPVQPLHLARPQVWTSRIWNMKCFTFVDQLWDVVWALKFRDLNENLMHHQL